MDYKSYYWYAGSIILPLDFVLCAYGLYREFFYSDGYDIICLIIGVVLESVGVIAWIGTLCSQKKPPKWLRIFVFVSGCVALVGELYYAYGAGHNLDPTKFRSENDSWSFSLYLLGSLLQLIFSAFTFCNCDDQDIKYSRLSQK